MKKKQLKFKARELGVISLAVFALATGLAVVGLSQTMTAIDEVAISKSPTAILANAGLSEEKDVFLSVAYFDQRMDECVNVYDMSTQEALVARQFEWSECEYYNKGLEKGLVNYDLDEKYLPVATKEGKLTPNRGMNFARWFDEVEGKSAQYIGNLKLEYDETEAKFSFSHDNFYPLDEVEFSKGDSVNNDGHNHLFTMNFAVPFTVLLSGEESFGITADDDTWVFVDNKLAIDMGGIHEAVNGRFVIQDNGEVYSAVGDEELAYTGITVGAGEGQLVRIFHADRDSADSVFAVALNGMNLSIVDTKLANREDEGVQIAYDPTDPTYVAPLGESSVVKPDGTRGFIIMATIEGVMVIVFAVLMAAALRGVVRRKLAEREAANRTSQTDLTGKK